MQNKPIFGFIILLAVFCIGCDQEWNQYIDASEETEDMAIKFDDIYPLNSTPADASYPQGSFKNITAPGGTDGSGLEKRWVNDLFGLLQAILADQGITPSGSPDTATSSQYLTGIKGLEKSLDNLGDGNAEVSTGSSIEIGSNADVPPATRFSDIFFESFSGTGTTYKQRVALEQGRINFGAGTRGPGDTDVEYRVSNFTMPLASQSTTDGILTLTPAFTLTGIPTASRILSVNLSVLKGASYASIPMTVETDDNAGILRVTRMDGVAPFNGIGGITNGELIITYDPSLVD